MFPWQCDETKYSVLETIDYPQAAESMRMKETFSYEATMNLTWSHPDRIYVSRCHAKDVLSLRLYNDQE